MKQKTPIKHKVKTYKPKKSFPSESVKIIKGVFLNADDTILTLTNNKKLHGKVTSVTKNYITFKCGNKSKKIPASKASKIGW